MFKEAIYHNCLSISDKENLPNYSDKKFETEFRTKAGLQGSAIINSRNTCLGPKFSFEFFVRIIRMNFFDL